MPLWTEHTETGVLMQSELGYILTLPGGGFWIVEGLPRRHRKLLGQRVTVTGIRVGFNALDVRLVCLAGLI